VLGANDGIVSTSSLVIGMAASQATGQNVWLAGMAGLIAGAMSMAAGEYVSVSSQADSENADRERERVELLTDLASERKELADIYIKRGLTPDLAKEVSAQLMAHDALGAHLRDELGITDTLSARPIQAALFSALSFSLGGAVPVILVAVLPTVTLPTTVAATSLVLLAAMGAVAAKIAGASILRSCLRVTFWGALAMAITAGVGHLIGAAI
jgi:VIT1/CCC1 family predicted Fe2+/Mn2+ transporter